MSNFFETEEAALKMALVWSGGIRKELTQVNEETTMCGFGYVAGVGKEYTVPNSNGEEAHFAIIKEPRGWSVWFIGNNGMTIRA